MLRHVKGTQMEKGQEQLMNWDLEVGATSCWDQGGGSLLQGGSRRGVVV